MLLANLGHRHRGGGSKGLTVEGHHIAYTPSTDFGLVDHVADAFRAPRYLVQLKYAQRTFTVAIDSVEAKTPHEAQRIALVRAQSAYDDLGDLLSAHVQNDNEKARIDLKVDGAEFAAKVSYSDKWSNVA